MFIVVELWVENRSKYRTVVKVKRVDEVLLRSQGHEWTLVNLK